MLDLEWARLGPPDLGFATISGDDAGIHARGFRGGASASELPLLAWLRADYPKLFDREHLTERVWLSDICFRIRQLCAWGASTRVRFRTWPASPCTRGCDSRNGRSRPARRAADVSGAGPPPSLLPNARFKPVMAQVGDAMTARPGPAAGHRSSKP